MLIVFFSDFWLSEVECVCEDEASSMLGNTINIFYIKYENL